ncbi:MAG: phosphatase PAP2 family protein [Gemmatimonadales bacterium]
MRIAEWINLTYFICLTALACVQTLPATRRRRITAFAILGIGLTLAGRFSETILGPEGSFTLRNWLPAVTILVAYWQAGQFYLEPSDRLQKWLQSTDDALGTALRVLEPLMRSRPLAAYLEVVYLLAYPFIPLALAVLVFSGYSRQADYFWSVVLLSSYACYGMLPFAPSLPPRLEPASGVDARKAWKEKHRALNLWVLGWLGIRANTFPSGHVAATLAASLVLLERLPLVGSIFLWVAVSIAVSTVVRRYHFFLDALLGALLALVFRILLGGIEFGEP